MACTHAAIGAGPMAHDVRSGDVERFEPRAAEFRSALIGYFRSRIAEPQEAEDLAHDVLVRLFRRTGISDMRALPSYVFETANSVFVDWMRRNKARARRSHQALDEDLPDPAVFACDRVLQSQEELRRVTASLYQLPERTRTIFILRRLEGMKHCEIASSLGVSLSTVEKHVHRATEHLLALPA